MGRPICAGCGHDLAYHSDSGCTLCERELGVCCRTRKLSPRQPHPATLLASDAQAWNAPGEIWRSRRKPKKEEARA